MVQLTKENEILINNSPNNCNEITKNIALNILKDKHYTLVVKLKEGAVFSDYINVLSYTRAGYLKACKIVAGEKIKMIILYIIIQNQFCHLILHTSTSLKPIIY
ncbi:MAG: hypothetical protein HC854_03570 [Flavobacterium sp.]|nr:hypothetical protein [Flavobacterium sp.]